MAVKKIQIRPKGNGTYNDILYPETSGDQVIMANGQTAEQLIGTALTTAQKGAANGVVPLDNFTKIPPEYMPVQTTIENRTSDPSTPATGRIWLRTDL